MGDYNRMCLKCQHFRNVCDGTKNQVWTGCILTDQDTEHAREYIKTMTALFEEAREKAEKEAAQ